MPSALVMSDALKIKCPTLNSVFHRKPCGSRVVFWTHTCPNTDTWPTASFGVMIRTAWWTPSCRFAAKSQRFKGLQDVHADNTVHQVQRGSSGTFSPGGIAVDAVVAKADGMLGLIERIQSLLPS